jgi:predicted nucleic acid-binding protein
MVVLDTNVLSELMRPRPAPAVEIWVAAQPSASLFTTAVTQAEVLLGLALLPPGRRRSGLLAAADAIFEVDLAGRVLSFDSAAAREFAVIAASGRQAGRPIAQADAQIASIARSRGAALATRNVADFEVCGVRVIDPWHA